MKKIKRTFTKFTKLSNRSDHITDDNKYLLYEVKNEVNKAFKNSIDILEDYNEEHLDFKEFKELLVDYLETLINITNNI